MTRADLVKRLREMAENRHRREWDMMSEADGGLTHKDRLEWMAAEALEQCERKCAEQAHEINTMKLVIRKMEERRR